MITTSNRDILSNIKLFSKIFVIAALINLALVISEVSASNGPEISKKTGLPLPRFVSLKGNKVNLRRGPSKNFKIDWVYKRKHLPLMIVSEFGHWRKVTDFESYSGWIWAALALIFIGMFLVQPRTQDHIAKPDPIKDSDGETFGH